MAKKVYLGGPITGTSYGEATNWRIEAYKFFEPYPEIVPFSPMREKGYLKDIENLSADCDVYKNLSCLSSNRGVVTRDRYDCTTANMFLVNLLGAKRVSIGTMFEYGWADLSRIPIVTVMEDSGNIHEHGFISEVSGFRVNNLEEGFHIVKKVLLP